MNARIARLTGLFLALAVLLTGCNLIEIDAKMQAEEDIAKLDKAYSAVVASYNGGEITANDSMAIFNAMYNEMYYMYQYYFGIELSEEEVQGMMESTLADMVRISVMADRFDQSYALTDEELAKAEADAQTSYDEAYAGLYPSAEGKDDEARNANTLVLLKEVGMEKEVNYANTLRDAKAARMQEILMAEVTELGDEDLFAAYQERVSEDEELYSLSDGSFESAMMEEDASVCWTPEGYRTVKHILLIPEDEVMSAYIDANYAVEDQGYLLEELQLELDMLLDNDPETTEGADAMRSEEEIRADLEAAEAQLPALRETAAAARQACLDNVQDRLDEVYARLNAGESFEAVMAEYGEDPGMQNEPTMSRGYYVSATSANWEQNFTDGAMALANVGDYSAEPVVSGSGVHIILYASDVAAGPADFESVRDALADSVLEEMQIEHADAIVAQWLTEANPSYDVEAFEKAIFSGLE